MNARKASGFRSDTDAASRARRSTSAVSRSTASANSSGVGSSPSGGGPASSRHNRTQSLLLTHWHTSSQCSNTLRALSSRRNDSSIASAERIKQRRKAVPVVGKRGDRRSRPHDPLAYTFAILGHSRYPPFRLRSTPYTYPLAVDAAEL